MLSVSKVYVYVRTAIKDHKLMLSRLINCACKPISARTPVDVHKRTPLRSSHASLQTQIVCLNQRHHDQQTFLLDQVKAIPIAFPLEIGFSIFDRQLEPLNWQLCGFVWEPQVACSNQRFSIGTVMPVLHDLLVGSKRAYAHVFQ